MGLDLDPVVIDDFCRRYAMHIYLLSGVCHT